MRGLCVAKERDIPLIDGVMLDDTLLYDVELLDHYRVRVSQCLRSAPMSTSPATDILRTILREKQRDRTRVEPCGSTTAISPGGARIPPTSAMAA